MNTYSVRVSEVHTEVVYYSVEIDAESEDDARDIAYEMDLYDPVAYGDSEYDDREVHDIEEIASDGDLPTSNIEVGDRVKFKHIDGRYTSQFFGISQYMQEIASSNGTYVVKQIIGSKVSLRNLTGTIIMGVWHTADLMKVKVELIGGQYV